MWKWSGDMAILSARQKMGAAALIMGFSVLLSRFMGLARDKVISWQFGAAGESDIYFTAFVVPDFINYLLAGGYISITLIPLLSALFEEDEEDGWRFFGAVFTWATLAILGLAVLGWLFGRSAGAACRAGLHGGTACTAGAFSAYCPACPDIFSAGSLSFRAAVYPAAVRGARPDALDI